MMRIAGVAFCAALSAVGAAKAVVMFEQHAPQPRPHELVLTAPKAAPAFGGEAQVLKAGDGHYYAEADVNGSSVKFLVDTGASAVALTQDDAQRLGISQGGLQYDYKVTTASGEARAAHVKLASISVSGAEVRDVDAFVIESGLQTSLLGMSYLGRLSRFEATQDSLILHP
ncbi:MAG TPA: TIGR02281 family clan AA aspartic protease [Caulobacteraceae bacterium]|nr:TIGR02281 family clan AA aspartic protease [Caulobacteraceae bacterium]